MRNNNLLQSLSLCAAPDLFALGDACGDAVSEGHGERDGTVRSLQRVLWFVVGHAFLSVLEGTPGA